MPSPVQIHLMMVHLPVVGMGIALILFIYGLRVQSQEIRKASLLLFACLIPAAGIAFLSGLKAEELVEHLPSITPDFIEPHEGMAIAALSGVIGTGILALLQLIWTRFSHSTKKSLEKTTLLFSFITVVLLALTANRGGKIHHGELLPGGLTPSTSDAHDADD